MEYRQRVADAAVADIEYQLGPDAVDQHGTSVQVDGGFKVVRVAEAIVKAAVVPDDPIIDEVARSITPPGQDWEGYRNAAVDAIAAVRGSILAQLDPLP